MLLLPLLTSSLLALTALGKLQPYDWEHGTIADECGGDYGDAQTSCSAAKSLLPAGADPFLDVPFESGYVGVGPKKSGQMFYWMFPKADADKSTPVILWLTGGPGCASTMAAVSENGPFNIDEDRAKLELNPWGWSGLGTLVYVDQPLGTGFSPESDAGSKIKDEDGVSQDLHEFLEGLIDKHPEFTDRPFFITGESFAGHYIPRLGRRLVENPVQGLNLRGVALGNAWVSPVLQFPSEAEFAHENGLISSTAYKLMRKGEAVCVKLIEKNIWRLALAQCDSLMMAMLGGRNCYDIRQTCNVPPMCYNTTGMDRFFNEPQVQRRLGVKRHWDECSSKVYSLLERDMLSDMREDVSVILGAGKQVLVYNGDQDLICNWRGGLSWTLETHWASKKSYREAPFRMWDYKSEHRGELKTYKNFAFLRLYQAGHLVPMDQPSSAYGMIEQFVKGELAPPADVSVPEEKYENADFLPVEFISGAAVMVTS